MDKYRIYLDKQILGPFELQELLTLPGFSENSQVCEAGDDVWQPARQFRAISAQLSPGANTFNSQTYTIHKPTTLSRFNSTPPHPIKLSGDFISPDYQFHTPKRVAGRIKRHPLPAPSSNKIRVIELPQPHTHSNFRRMVILTLLILVGGSLWADKCEYSLTATHLLQCRPIKLVENEEHQALWTYVEESKEKVLAHLLCSCDTAAASFQPLCEAPRTHKVTFTIETQDIRETCGQGAALCQDPCLKLINH